MENTISELTYQQALRLFQEATGMARNTIKTSIKIAHEKFNGDILMGFGYVEARSYSVYRGEGDKKENSLINSAKHIALRYADMVEFKLFVSVLNNQNAVEKSLILGGKSQ